LGEAYLHICLWHSGVVAIAALLRALCSRLVALRVLWLVGERAAAVGVAGGAGDGVLFPGAG
jgi:hypothetical protein